MNTFNHGWNNLNELRAWPLSESATGIALSGASLPESVLTDMVLVAHPAIRFYISSVRITPMLVSVSVASEDRHLSLVCSVRQPVEEGRAYMLEPLSPGVAGWFTLGSGATRPGLGLWRFDGVADGEVDPAAVRPDVAPGVSTFERFGSPATAMSGVVRVRSGVGIDVSADPVANTVVLSLSKTVSESLRSKTCAGRLMLSECGSPVLRTINGMPGAVDANGKVTMTLVVA